MAAKMMRGSPNGTKPVYTRLTVPSRKDQGPPLPIAETLIERLQEHAGRHSGLHKALKVGGGNRMPINKVIDFALNGVFDARTTLQYLTLLNQREAICAVLLHQALRFLIAADHAIAAPPDLRDVDPGDDPIPF
jgi:hypothetical protein